MKPAKILFWIMTGLTFFSAALPSFAARFPEKPRRGSFYSDEAGLLDAAAGERVNELCRALWKEQKVPLYVVTITSLADHDVYGETVKGFAYDIFNNWGIGSQTRNYGILILVSLGDRKARIELGSGWGYKHDFAAERLMREGITPNFRNGDYSRGLIEGVEGMNALARGLELPKPKALWWTVWVQIGVFVLVVVVAYSLFKSGRTGWGWAFLAGVGALLVFLLQIASSIDDCLDGGGDGMDGGSSDGGGASGSW